jgi:ribosome-associated heat shock protein Hsp15
MITARVGVMTRTVRFLAMPKSRIGAKLIADFAEDLTPPEERVKRPERNLLPPGFRPVFARRARVAQQSASGVRWKSLESNWQTASHQ